MASWSRHAQIGLERRGEVGGDRVAPLPPTCAEEGCDAPRIAGDHIAYCAPCLECEVGSARHRRVILGEGAPSEESVNA